MTCADFVRSIFYCRSFARPLLCQNWATAAERLRLYWKYQRVSRIREDETSKSVHVSGCTLAGNFKRFMGPLGVCLPPDTPDGRLPFPTPPLYSRGLRCAGPPRRIRAFSLKLLNFIGRQSGATFKMFVVLDTPPDLEKRQNQYNSKKDKIQNQYQTNTQSKDSARFARRIL